MDEIERYQARMAGIWNGLVMRAKKEIRDILMYGESNRVALTITEDAKARWAAAKQMVEAGELIVLRELRRETRRGPARRDGTRRVRREMQVALENWDPVTRQPFERAGDDERI